MVAGLDQEGLALLKLLVQVLRDADPSDPRTFITYTEAHKRLGLRVLFGNAGRSLQKQGLNSLATWTTRQNVPSITGLIVRELERDPGPGYFKANGKREIEDLPWWLEEMKRAKETDWGPYLGGLIRESKVRPPIVEPSSSQDLTIATIARSGSRFFLKSEYGRISADWPVVAFSSKAVGSRLQRDFLPEKDFIVYTGTGGPATGDPAHRGRLLSVVRIDTGEVCSTKESIPPRSWKWAQEDYPGHWESCFKALEAWQIVDFPRSTEIIPSSYSKMGVYPNRGGVLEITGTERKALLKLQLKQVSLTGQTSTGSTKEKRPANDEKALLDDAKRIANLIFARVAVSGTTMERIAPERTAPDDLVINVRDLLRAKPLLCYLCGGLMQIRPQNRLLQPSPDRIDSTILDYGPENLKLAHLACNLGKNAASLNEYQEWLQLMRGK
jgi:hypothetical protein